MFTWHLWRFGLSDIRTELAKRNRKPSTGGKRSKLAISDGSLRFCILSPMGCKTEGLKDMIIHPMERTESFQGTFVSAAIKR